MKKKLYFATLSFLLFLYMFLGISSAIKKSPTFDEPIHIAAGYVVWKMNDYRLDPENGILPNLLSSFPLLFFDSKVGITIPDRNDTMWDRHDRWRLTQRIFNTDPLEYDRIFLYSRIMMIATVGLLSAISIFFISLHIWGKTGALISLTLFSLSPTLLANSQLANSDMSVALFFLLTSYFFWIMLKRFTLIKLTGFAISFALLLLSKMSAFIIFPILLIIALAYFLIKKKWGIHIWNRRFPVSKCRIKIGILLSVFLFTSLFSFSAIWAVYGLRFSMLPDQQGREGLNTLWEKALQKNGFPQKTIRVARKYKILPEAYLYGMAYVLRHLDLRHAFIDGKYGKKGWYSFFPLCFIYKTPLSVVLLVIIGFSGSFLIFAEKNKKRKYLLLLKLSLPVAILTVYLSVAVISKLNIGHRHLLPIYMPMFLIAGGSAILVRRARRFKWLIVILLFILLSDNILIYPDYISYFSSVAGGPSNGYRHLVDSSLDWGQDLKELKLWLKKEHPDINQVYISYFGSNDLDVYKMKQRRLLCDLEQKSLSLFKLEKGTYCISATMLQMVYFQDVVDWNADHEKEFRKHQRCFNSVYDALKNPEKMKQLLSKNSKKSIEKSLRNYEKLRFAKLAYGLRKKSPDKMINYSILIYDLSSEDLKTLVNE